MNDANGKRQLAVILWCGVLILGGLAVIKHPTTARLNQANQELVSLKQDYSQQKKAYLTKTPLTNNFNLPEAENTATQKITEAFQTGYGEIHSDDDWKSKKGGLQATLGKKLTDVVYHHAYNTESKKYVIKKNTKTLVFFEDVVDRHNVVINVVTTYQMAGGSNASYLYRINYDLANQKLLRYSEESFQ